MPRLGGLTIDQLLDEADKDTAYLANRLTTQARDRGVDPDDIEEVITRALTTSIRSHVLVARNRAAKLPSSPEPARTATDTSAPERSELQACDALTAALVALGVNATTINTGGNCWASSIQLTETAHLLLNDFSGSWSYTLDDRGDTILTGHWGPTEDRTTAANIKALITAMGTITG
ncbi:hypothetical protein ACFYWS_20750 [Streptomyces sp. NPDC002795]|uniref:hypothetical protein n=1 Tax=Streptomyces sp. NPDC002795 TaxID=3364665 RepID=UPI003679DB81